MGNYERENIFSPEQERFVTQRMVVKIGGSTITKDGNPLNELFIENAARQITELTKAGVDIVVVSSGAVPSGRAIYEARGVVFDDSTEGKKVLNDRIAATCGQPELSRRWREAFERNNVIAHELLLTDRDLDETQDVINGILAIGGIPIINGHDAVSKFQTEQINISADNDQLAGHIARSIRADTLLLLTDANGILDATGATIPYVDETMNIQEVITNSGSGIGGMKSKAGAAKDAAKQWKNAIIANGHEENVILKVAQGVGVGTRFKNERPMDVFYLAARFRNQRAAIRTFALTGDTIQTLKLTLSGVHLSIPDVGNIIVLFGTTPPNDLGHEVRRLLSMGDPVICTEDALIDMFILEKTPRLMVQNEEMEFVSSLKT